MQVDVRLAISYFQCLAIKLSNQLAFVTAHNDCEQADGVAVVVGAMQSG